MVEALGLIGVCLLGWAVGMVMGTARNRAPKPQPRQSVRLRLRGLPADCFGAKLTYLDVTAEHLAGLCSMEPSGWVTLWDRGGVTLDAEVITARDSIEADSDC